MSDSRAEQDIDLLMNIIDNARHIAWKPGPKVEPMREALAAVPRDVRERYELRKRARHVATGGNLSTRSIAPGGIEAIRATIARTAPDHDGSEEADHG